MCIGLLDLHSGVYMHFTSDIFFMIFSYQIKNQTIKIWLRWRFLAIILGVQQKCCVGFRVHMASSTTLKALEDHGRQLVDAFRILAEEKFLHNILSSWEHSQGSCADHCKCPHWIWKRKDKTKMNLPEWWGERRMEGSKNTTSSVKLLNWRPSRAFQGRKLSIWSYPWVTDVFQLYLSYLKSWIMHKNSCIS